jgi:hypothetical protein
MELMDIVIQALTSAHLMVILDDHTSNADWCCNEQLQRALVQRCVSRDEVDRRLADDIAAL